MTEVDRDTQRARRSIAVEPAETTNNAGHRRGAIERLQRSGVGRIAGISASLVGTQALTSVLGLVFWTFAAREFIATDVGVAGAAIALMMLVGSLGSLGLGTVLIARLPSTDVSNRRVLVRTCLMAAAAGGTLLGLVVPTVAMHVFGAIALAPIAGSILPLLGFAAGTALTSVVIVLDQAVLTIGFGTLQLERNATASAVKVVALLLLGLAGVHGGMVIFLAWAIGNTLSLPVVAWRTRGGRALASGHRLVEPRALRGIGRLAASHQALNVSIQAALQLLPVLVLVLVSARANASFNAAIMVAGFVFALPYAVSVGLFAAARGDESEVIRRMRLTIPFGLAVSAAADLVLFPLAGPVLHVFGTQYAADGTILLRLVVLAGLPFVVKDHFIALRRVQGRTTQAVAVMAAFLVLELSGAVIGAHVAGVVGLCVGWLAVLVVEALALAGPIIVALRKQFTTLQTEAAISSLTISPEASASLLAEPMELPVTPPEQPEQPTRERKVRPRPARFAFWFSRNLTGPTILLMSLGVLVMAAVANAGRAGGTGVLLQLGWIGGLLIVFVPPALRIIVRSTPAIERVALAIGLGMMLQFSRLVLNPTIFAFHDELIHAETVRQIDETGRLFTSNPLLPVSAYYPGLEIVTDGVQRLTGLTAFAAAIITLALARLILVLAIIALIRLISGSYRAGAVGVLIYLANPQLLFFNSQYSYQTLALPLAVLSIYLFATRRRGSRWSLALPMAATTTVVFTHHLTAAFLIVTYGVWFLLVVVHRRRVSAGAVMLVSPTRRSTARAESRNLLIMTLFSGLLLGLSVMNPGNPLISYLSAIAGSFGTDLVALSQGHQTKALFADSAGSGPAPWEQLLLILAVLIATAAMLIVLTYIRTSWRAARPLAVLLGLLALLYPVIPLGHLTAATAEGGDRAAGFVFLGVALVVGTWWWRRRRRRAIQFALLLACTVVFLGNIVLGAGSTASQLPGPYAISADARSVDADNLAAAYWLNANVPHGSIVYGDRTSGMLAAAYGGQTTVLHVSTGIDASRLLLAPTVTDTDIALIRATKLDYLIVDERLSSGLPHQQDYIESGEYGGAARTTPVSAQALRKFASIPGVTPVYDNGSLVIYDVRGLR